MIAQQRSDGSHSNAHLQKIIMTKKELNREKNYLSQSMADHAKKLPEHREEESFMVTLATASTTL